MKRSKVRRHGIKLFWPYIAAIIILLILFLIYLILSGGIFVGADSSKMVKISTNFSSYYQKEPVAVILSNNTMFTKNFTNFFWIIKDNKGKEVYRSSTENFKLLPNQTKTSYWNQKNLVWQYVVSGAYSVSTTNNVVNVRTAPIIVNDQVGSDGHFTFEVNGEIMSQYFTNSQTIRDAIDNFYQKNNKSIPSGLIKDDRPGRSKYDNKYKWHMSESDTRMVGMAMEICDGLPSDIEKDINYWLTQVRYFCPWSAKVMISQAGI